MTRRLIVGAALLVLGLGSPAFAQGLQPGMRTMIQQGGIEPGPLLGAVLPGEGYAPGFGFIPRREAFEPDADPRYGYRRVAARDGMRFRRTMRRHARHRAHRHHFAR